MVNHNFDSQIYILLSNMFNLFDLKIKGFERIV